MPSDYYERELKEHMNTRGDVAPPWVKYPHYERFTIGWRMGGGEDHLHLWGHYLKTLGDEDARLRHLRRHGLAPMNWSASVLSALRPALYGELDEGADATRELLALELGLAASDVAVENFGAALARGDAPAPSWVSGQAPASSARYGLRELWFHGRLHHRARRRGDAVYLELAPSWSHLTDALRSGTLPQLDASRGLASIAAACVAGEVPGPWSLGMELGDFADTFDTSMNYVDAYRLWLMSCIDDSAQLEGLLDAQGAPVAWRAWAFEQAIA